MNEQTIKTSKMIEMRWLLIFFCLEISVTLAEFNLTILHTNDVHSRFVGFNSRLAACSATDTSSGKCFGGAARRSTTIKQIRDKEKSVLLLDGGDQYQGTLWYTALKWSAIADYMNYLKYDAMAFGNHEFDDGPAGLAPFLKNISFPIVNSNIDASKSLIAGLFNRSVILERYGQKIGFIGYTTPETAELSLPGPTIHFNEPIESLKKVVKELQSLGINKIIAIGHAGITVDRKICQEVPGVDIVVGGHTNTFLYAGTPPSAEVAEGPYPEAYTSTGATCLVVQDFAYGKYLGSLKITFDNKGELQKWSGNPILLNTSVKEDPEMVKLLKPYSEKLAKLEKEQVATTDVALDGTMASCRLRECSFGSLVADAFDYFYEKSNSSGSNATARRVHGSVVNGGAIIEYQAEPHSKITLGQLYTIMPYGSTIDLIKIKGKYLYQVFERSVEDYSAVDQHGKFLQVSSGLKVVYDLSKPNGQRVVSLMTKCLDCKEIKFEKVEQEKVYNIVLRTFIRKGGDGYSMIEKNLISADGSEMVDIDAVLEYLKKVSPYKAVDEHRISFIKKKTFFW